MKFKLKKNTLKLYYFGNKVFNKKKTKENLINYYTNDKKQYKIS